jgi:hypothetical protein
MKKANINNESRLKYLKKVYKLNKDLLFSINSLLNKDNIDDQKTIDIISLLKGGVSKINSGKNLELIYNLHQKILIKSKITPEINKVLFVNFLTMYNSLSHRKKNKIKFERKLLLLIEYYLMIEQDIILSQQIEFIIYISHELINNHKNSSIFQFGFLYLKISEILHKRKLTYKFRNELTEIKNIISLNIPNNSKGKELNTLLDKKY